MRLRGPAIALLTSLALLAALALGVTGTPWAAVRDAATPTDPPSAGGTVCASGGGAATREVDTVLAAPPGSAGGDAQDTVSGRGILLAVEGTIERTAVGPFRPGSVDVVRSDLGADGWIWSGWADHPLVAWREWRSPGAPGEPRATVVARCIPADAPEWVVLGLRTDGGNEALLMVVNPYAADATFAVTLRTEDATFAPIALRNVSVPAGTRVSVRLNDHLPEESDVSAIVTVGAGRLAVEGLQRAIAGVGGVEGVSTVPAQTAPSVTWTFPWLPAGPEVDAAVWILNPEPRTVAVEMVVHTPQGAGPAELVDRVEVPAGGLIRLDTADLAPAGRRTFGLTVRSETSGVYVAAGARTLAADPARTGLVRLVASAAPDRAWLDAGTHAPGRETVLHVVNLAEDAAQVQVELTFRSASVGAPVVDGPDATDGGPDGAQGGAQGGAGSTDAVTTVLEAGVLAPGAATSIVLPLIAPGAWSAVVTGGEALVVSRTGTGVELLEPVAIDAVPSRAWRVPATATLGRPFDGWVARLGTPGALERAVRPLQRPEDVLPGALLPTG